MGVSGEVSPTAQEFADLVIDRLLARGCELLPGSVPAAAMQTTEPAPPVPPPGGALAERVAGANAELARRRAAVRRVDEEGALVLAAAGEVAAGARREAELLREQARARAAAILPKTNSAAGMRLLVSVLDQSIAALQDRLETVAEANAAAAGRLRELAGEYGPRPV